MMEGYDPQPAPRRASSRTLRDIAFAALVVLVVAVPIVVLARQGASGGGNATNPQTALATATATAGAQGTPTTGSMAGMNMGQGSIPAKLANCTPDVVPTGQADPSPEAEPMGPNWCFPLTGEPTSRVSTGDSWVDNFDTNVQMGHLNDGEMGYRVYDNVNGVKSQVFVNNNHWMPDVMAGGTGGSMIRPDRSFTYQNGKLVVEADVAAAIPGYGNDTWPEIDISTAPNPTTMRADGLYGYDMFTGAWVIGCRLQSSDRDITCSMFNPQSQRDADNGRIWEVSFFKTAYGGTVDGGTPASGQICNTSGQCTDASKVFRVCKNNQMDMYCRDRFRLELTQHTLTVYINGYKYFTATLPGYAAIPDAMLHGQNYVYLTSWVGQNNSFDVARFHWGRVAVNPTNSNGTPQGPTAAPSFCLGRTQDTCPM